MALQSVLKTIDQASPAARSEPRKITESVRNSATFQLALQFDATASID